MTITKKYDSECNRVIELIIDTIGALEEKLVQNDKFSSIYSQIKIGDIIEAKDKLVTIRDEHIAYLSSHMKHTARQDILTTLWGRAKNLACNILRLLGMSARSNSATEEQRILVKKIGAITEDALNATNLTILVISAVCEVYMEKESRSQKILSELKELQSVFLPSKEKGTQIADTKTTLPKLWQQFENFTNKLGDELEALVNTEIEGAYGSAKEIIDRFFENSEKISFDSNEKAVESIKKLSREVSADATSRTKTFVQVKFQSHLKKEMDDIKKEITNNAKIIESAIDKHLHYDTYKCFLEAINTIIIHALSFVSEHSGILESDNSIQLLIQEESTGIAVNGTIRIQSSNMFGRAIDSMLAWRKKNEESQHMNQSKNKYLISNEDVHSAFKQKIRTMMEKLEVELNVYTAKSLEECCLTIAKNLSPLAANALSEAHLEVVGYRNERIFIEDLTKTMRELQRDCSELKEDLDDLLESYSAAV